MKMDIFYHHSHKMILGTRTFKLEFVTISVEQRGLRGRECTMLINVLRCLLCNYLNKLCFKWMMRYARIEFCCILIKIFLYVNIDALLSGTFERVENTSTNANSAATILYIVTFNKD